MEKERKELLDFLKSEHSKHGPITVSWNGGNDDGYVYVSRAGVRLDPDEYYTEDGVWSNVVSLVENFIGYGSFAGDFCCDGEVTFVPVKKAFIGHDNFEESEYHSIDLNPEDGFAPIKISVPEDLWFESINIELNDDDLFGVDFTIEGPVHDMHRIVADKIEADLNDKYQEILKICYSNHKDEVSAAYESHSYRFDEFVHDPVNKIRYVYKNETSVQFTVANSKVIEIPIN
jgi:hypothetical protein